MSEIVSPILSFPDKITGTSPRREKEDGRQWKGGNRIWHNAIDARSIPQPLYLLHSHPCHFSPSLPSYSAPCLTSSLLLLLSYLLPTGVGSSINRLGALTLCVTAVLKWLPNVQCMLGWQPFYNSRIVYCCCTALLYKVCSHISARILIKRFLFASSNHCIASL